MGIKCLNLPQVGWLTLKRRISSMALGKNAQDVCVIMF